jgi:DNA-directed RNA polymerase subunit RPC12/RpoP
MPLECLSCGQQFDEAVVRYYSDEMREERLMCPHCQCKDFKKWLTNDHWQLPFVHINVNMLY